jgi:hypothetical protein
MSRVIDLHLVEPLWLLLFSLLFACCDVNAGWYQVTNYEGRIGEYPIHFSIQEYDYFGSGLNVRGSYFYDKNRGSIPLYGKLDKNGGLSLCEIHTADQYWKILMQGSLTPIDTSGCPFQLKLTKGSASGRWSNDGRSYDVALLETAHLNDTQGFRTSGLVEIPFWGQTTGHLFIGSYALEGAEGRATVKVVDKRTGQVIQEIQPEKHGCTFGFLMTPIYMNVESSGTGRSEEILINCYDSGAGSVALYKLNMAKRRFEFVSSN